MKKALKSIIDYTRIFIGKVVKEKNSFKVPLITKIYMNLRGFTADQYVRYDFRKNDMNEYITEIERWQSRRINGRYNIVMDDKLICKEVFGSYISFPKTLAWVKNGSLYNLNGEQMCPKVILDLLEEHKAVVLKPVIMGGSGKGLHVIKAREDKIFVDENPKSEACIINLIKELDDYIAEECVTQHDYSSKIFDKTINTIRLITLMNDNGKAEITHAVHRIGVNESIPVDNTMQGALVAEIDLDAGVLGRAKTLFDTEIYRHHPDTGALIEGVQLPFWNEIKEKVVDVAERFPNISFMAWDIAITDKSFVVIEINASTGLNLFQIWRGERHSRLGEFYRKHGIIK